MSKFNSRKLQDLKQGETAEQMIFNVIKNKWNINHLKKTENFHTLDFIDENNNFYEIKSRNNNYNKYATTMIGLNKIEYINKNNLNCIFIFSFTDGNYYYQYNKEDNFEISKGGRNDRGRPEYKQYIFIPIDKLNKI